MGTFERLPHTTREFTTPTGPYSGPTETIFQRVLQNTHTVKEVRNT